MKAKYFILEKDSMRDGFEDCLELRDSKAIKQIAQSKKDYSVGRTEDAWFLLSKLKKTTRKKKVGLSK